MPFGPAAFFPGHLGDASAVYMQLPAAEGKAASASGGSGKFIGAGASALEELTLAQATEWLRALLPPAQQQAKQMAPARPPPQQQQVEQQQEQQLESQLASLTDSQTPEQLEALRTALQQLGASLDEQQLAVAAAAASGGGTGSGVRGQVLPSPEVCLCVVCCLQLPLCFCTLPQWLGCLPGWRPCTLTCLRTSPTNPPPLPIYL